MPRYLAEVRVQFGRPLAVVMHFIPDEMHAVDLETVRECLLDPFQDHLASVVATHDIHDDPHKAKERRVPATPPRS